MMLLSILCLSFVTVGSVLLRPHSPLLTEKKQPVCISILPSVSALSLTRCSCNLLSGSFCRWLSSTQVPQCLSIFTVGSVLLRSHSLLLNEKKQLVCTTILRRLFLSHDAVVNLLSGFFCLECRLFLGLLHSYMDPEASCLRIADRGFLDKPLRLAPKK